MEKEIIEEPKLQEVKEVKRSPIVTTILIVLLLAVVGVGGWILGVSKAASLVEEAKNNNSETVEKTTEDETSTEKENAIQPIDLTKDINNTGNEYDNPKKLTKSKEDLGISVVKVDDKSVKINYDAPEKLCTFYSIKDCSTITSRKSDTVNFDKNVSDVYIGFRGQDSTDTVVLYLMEDGTMQYYRLSKNNTFDFNDLDNKVEGTVEGVKDVVNLYSATVIEKPVGSYLTILGSKADGSFYDLGKIIFNK